MIFRTTVPGGIKVSVEHIPYVRSASVGFWVRAGSRCETDAEHGISHFIEHMLFKGTHTRSARDLAEAMDATGGHLNAFTAREMTCYYARVPDHRVELAVELIADMLVNPRLDPADMDKEKAVVLEEIKMCEDTPDDLVHELFNTHVFRGHPLGRSVLGTEQSVMGLSRADLKNYMASHYTADNVVVSVAGHVEPRQVAEWTAHYLENLPRGGTAPRKQPSGPRIVGAATEVWREKDIEQVHLCVGGPGLPRGHEKRFAVHVLDTALGGGMSSRLFQELREERGLVYSVYSFHQSFADAGLFGVYAATNPQQVREVTECMAAELERVRRHGLNADELARAKEQLKGGLLLSLESTSTRMSRLGKSELFDEPRYSPEELVKRVEAVTLDDVAWVADTLLAPEPWVFAAVGPRVEGAFAPFAGGTGRRETEVVA